MTSAPWLRVEHRATLLSMSRDDRTITNLLAEHVVQPGDDALVVAVVDLVSWRR